MRHLPLPDFGPTEFKPLPLEMSPSDYLAFELYRRGVIDLGNFVAILEKLEVDRNEHIRLLKIRYGQKTE